ncbi:MAG: hypothetical protein J2P36_14935, partial [Ktedonobacteraceae bacterium]|nr:hypothetical protein [Ktedonobacteraceae bacterium]
ARKLVEEALLNDFTQTLPITGKDIMHEFQLGPGPLIRILLQQARIFFQEGRRSRDAIFEKLHIWYDAFKAEEDKSLSQQVGSVVDNPNTSQMG